MVKLCKRGHPRTPENVGANRACKECAREYKRRPEYLKYAREYSRRYRFERYETDAEYRERDLQRSRERYYSADPHIHFLMLAKQVRRESRERKQRIAARAGRPKVTFSQIIEQAIKEEVEGG